MSMQRQHDPQTKTGTSKAGLARWKRWLQAAWPWLAAVSLLLFILAISQFEPSFQGKRASAWLTELANDEAHFQRACLLLREMGIDATKAVPVLIRQLRSEKEAIRLLAVQGLGYIGPPAEIALEAIESMSSDPSIRIRQEAHRAWRSILYGGGDFPLDITPLTR